MVRQLIFTAALLLAGCGSGPAVACDEVLISGSLTVRTCTEIVELDSDQIDAEKQFCKNGGGIVIDACSIDNQLGVCTFIERGIPRETHLYAADGVTGAEGKIACDKIDGSWTDG